MSTGARRARTAVATRPQPEHTVTHAALVDYLANGAVTELVLAETEPGTWRLEALLSWKPGRSVLTAARGGERLFRSLDTLASFLRTVGIGSTIVRLELRS